MKRTLSALLTLAALAMGSLVPMAAAAESQVSDQPAPASKAKRVIGAVHTDAVSAYLDNGELVLETKADIDVTGDGVIDVGSRLTARELLFHLSDESKVSVPDLPAYSFLGQPGTTIWLSPQTQDHRLIWPGFSTEDPKLAGQVKDNTLAVRLLDTEGPGEVEVYLQHGTDVQRVFSSTVELAPWTIGVPQHTHMNWAFSAPGTYTLTFEMAGTVGGRPQVATNRYTFVVGDLDAHTLSTSTVIAASPKTAAAGEPVTLTATMTPAGAEGAVQFRDLSTGRLLGYSPLADGRTEFVAGALPPGEHRIVAEFVPTWSDDFVPSTSSPVTVTVSGTVQTKPGFDDTVPVPDADLAAHTPATAVTTSSPGKTLVAGASLTGRVSDPALSGTWLSVWIPGLDPAWRGWVQADMNGAFTVQLPSPLANGQYRMVVKTPEGTLVGWDAFSIANPEQPTPTPVPTPNPVPQETPQPQAPVQNCAPGVTLETGHIDAFTVSAAGDKAVLQVMEDVTGYRVMREAETVLLRVKESAYRSNIPAGTPGAPSGYVLPLTQDSSLIWPGWDTNRTAASGYTDVTINIARVEGPGSVYLSSQGPFGGVESLLSGGGYRLPGSIREAAPAHTHAQWVFSTKGIYRLTAYAVATNPTTGRSLTTATHTYFFQVGDVPLGDTFCGVSTVAAADAVAVNAAVTKAAAEAVQAEAEAAEQAAVEQAAAEEAAKKKRGVATHQAEAEHDTAVAAAAGHMDRTVVAGLITGGILIIGGVAAATFFYLRLLRKTSVV